MICFNDTLVDPVVRRGGPRDDGIVRAYAGVYGTRAGTEVGKIFLNRSADVLQVAEEVSLNTAALPRTWITDVRETRHSSGLAAIYL